MSDNESAIPDQDGDFSDWIELYNNSNDAVNLMEYGLSDNRNNLRKWLFPDLLVPAKGHVLIFASGKDRTAEDELHSNFKISADGEELFLTNNLGILIDSIHSEKLSADESLGRFPDGSTRWLHTFSFTPGTSNNSINHLLFSSAEGFYRSPFYLSIESSLEDSLRYTLDGSEPTAGSALYTDSIFIDYKYESANYFSEFPSTPDQSVISYKAWELPDVNLHKAHVIRCASFKNGIRTSKIYTHTYFVDSTIFEKYNLPVISMVTDEKNLFDHEKGIYLPGKYFDSSNPEWTGNYFQTGSDWERPVHITFFETDGRTGFSQDAGIRIHGYKSRQAAQKSFRLYARKEYGMKNFNYPLLPNRKNEEYKRFLLRATMGDWWNNTLIRDVLAHEIVKDLDLEYQDYKPAIVYLNGEYWGIYFIRDYVDERYISYLYDYDKDSVDIIEGNYMDVKAGSNASYIKLAKFINQNNLAVDDNYEYVKTQVDISNFIDYYIAEMFLANLDWPFNNQRLWRPQTPDGKWRWIFFDADAAFGNAGTNMFSHSLTYSDRQWNEMSVSTFIFKNLIKNESFVEKFVARYAEVLNTDFSLEIVSDKLDEIKALIELELSNNISRWKVPESFSLWNYNLQNNLLGFLTERPCAVEKNIVDFFDVPEFGFSCTTDNNDSQNPIGGILIGPNPSNGSFSIYNNAKDMVLDEIIIVDGNGRIYWSEKKILFGKGEKKQFSLKIPAGLYFIQYSTKEGAETKKIIISP